MLKQLMEIFFGWNLSSENNIEQNLVLGYIENLKQYIPSEDIEYLKSIDFNKSDKTISENDSKKIINIIKDAENTRESQSKTSSELER